MLQMLARRDLRDDAAEGLMPRDLGVDEVHADVAVALEQCDRSLVARGFDSKDHGRR
jgi:hypothetical protein